MTTESLSCVADTDPSLDGIERELAPGVLGYTFAEPDTTYVPLVIAKNPGNGDVSRWLDSLPRDRSYCFPNVINATLDGMLRRRGFTDFRLWAEQYGEWIHVLARPAAATVADGAQRHGADGAVGPQAETPKASGGGAPTQGEGA